MLALHRRTIPAAVLTLALGWGIAGCSSDEGDTPAYIGTWNAVSLTIQGSDLIDQGMDFSMVFNSNGTFATTTTNDLAGFCDPGMNNCTESGPYTASDTQITLDAGTSDAFTVNYSISGTTMTLTFTLNGMFSVLVLDKV